MRKRRKAWGAKVAQKWLVLTDAPIVALENTTADKDAHGKFESGCPSSSGAPELHEDTRYRAGENFTHTRTKIRHPQTNGIGERFPKTQVAAFYRVAFRRKIARTPP